MASNTEKSHMNYICMYVCMYVCGTVFFFSKCAAIIGSLKIIHHCICELKFF